MGDKPRVVSFLASGRGSNFRAVAGRIVAGKIPGARAGRLVVDNPQAGAIAAAREMKIPVDVVDYADYGKNRRSLFDAAILETLRGHSPDLIVAAGFMKILSAETVNSFPNRIINIHPSLLPAFPGVKAQEQAFQYGVKITGCTVHFVDTGLDSGPIILQKALTVGEDWSLETLRREILKLEHQALPEAVGLVCAGRVTVEGRRIRVRAPKKWWSF